MRLGALVSLGLMTALERRRTRLVLGTAIELKIREWFLGHFHL
jgi:hypothetical protein